MWRGLVCIVTLLLATGCSPTRGGSESEEPLRDQYAAVVADLPTVSVEELSDPAVPSGFTEADVDVFVDQAKRMMRRSFDGEVATMDPDAAVDEVTRGLYATSAYRLRLDNSTAYPGAAWQWNVATLVPEGSASSRFVAARWASSSKRARLDNGTSARVLSVTLQAHAVVSTKVSGGGGPTYILRRTITMTGAKPRGGPDWWPSVQIATSTWGNDGCELLKSAELVPAEDATVLRTDLAEAEASLQANGIIQPNALNPEGVRSYLDQCEKSSRD